MFELQSKRLRYRNYTDADFYFLKGLLQSKDMMRYIGDGHTRNDEEVAQFASWIYAHYKQDENLGLKIIEIRKTGEPIGHAGIVPQILNGEHKLEIGYWIAQAYWGQKYATEAAETFVHFAEQLHGDGELIAIIQPNNIPSIKVAQTIGMKLGKADVYNGQNVHIYKKEF